MQNTEPFREKLLQLKKEMLEKMQAINTDIKHEGMSADWEEQATERENDEVLESLGNASQQELAQINQALERIKDGEYFTCSQCGADIPASRLELLPYTSLCVECAEANEKQRKNNA